MPSYKLKRTTKKCHKNFISSYAGSMSTDDFSGSSKHAYVAFPGSPYTQGAALKAAHSVLASRGWTVTSDGDATEVPEGQDLYLADYDLLPFEQLLPSVKGKGKQAQCSSYVIRKALIRKHYLAAALHSYAVKAGDRSSFFTNCTPQTWHLDIQFADELQELLMDDLYELGEQLRSNDEALLAGDTSNIKWFILKPGMADRGNGIRIFATLDQLEEIFIEFEPDSDEEDDDDKEEQHSASIGKDTSVMTSQLRHFVIQEYVQTPMLIQPRSSETHVSQTQDSQGARKFHLRAYVLCVAGVSVYLYDDMLALFAPLPYCAPSLESFHDLRSHLTNTCLQDDGSIAVGDQGRPKEENVFLWSDLLGSTTCAGPSAKPVELTANMIATVRTKAGQVIGAVFEAAAKAGSIHWQVWPNAFEIFGVDLLVGYDDDHSPNVQLLEVNAQPDFAQTGIKLHAIIDRLFQRALEISVLPYHDENNTAKDFDTWSVGDSRQGMTLCFQEELGRGF